MSNANEPVASRFDVVTFAETLGSWLESNLELLLGLSALRDLGDQAFSAVTAVLLVREVRKLRLGWELWEAMAEGQGDDPEALLLDAAPLTLIELGRRALWGEQRYDERCLTLV